GGDLFAFDGDGLAGEVAAGLDVEDAAGNDDGAGGSGLGKSSERAEQQTHQCEESFHCIPSKMNRRRAIIASNVFAPGSAYGAAARNTSAANGECLAAFVSRGGKPRPFKPRARGRPRPHGPWRAGGRGRPPLQPGRARRVANPRELL